MTALYLHGELAGGVGVGHTLPRGWLVLAQGLAGPAVECDGIGRLTTTTSDDRDDHGGGSHPTTVTRRTDCPGCRSSRWGVALTFVKVLGK